VALSLAAAQAAVVQVDPKIPAYQKVSGVSGNLSSVGSDTMNNLMTLWAEGFARFYPNVKVQVEGKGSSTAPPALIEGTAQLGPMSRPMKSSEIDAFEKRHGFKPIGLQTAIDALAVYVHRDNPLEALTLPQVDAIFSKTRRLGYVNEISSWSQLGLGGQWAGKPISLYGRNSASGTYGYFKEHALGKGDYKDQVKEQPGSASVVQGISEDRLGIGYSGIGYLTSGVRAVPLAEKEGSPPTKADYASAVNGSYPLARALYLYIGRDPQRPLDPLVREFGRFIFSREGQEVVIKDGYMPLPADLCLSELEKLE
jgi:phosphate transport system substrate-binding protein